MTKSQRVRRRDCHHSQPRLSRANCAKRFNMEAGYPSVRQANGPLLVKAGLTSLSVSEAEEEAFSDAKREALAPRLDLHK